MPADLTPDAVRSRSFAKGRRGYDRDEVDRFVAEVADRLAAVETSLAQAEARLDQLGLKDAPALDIEFQRIGTDIADLLEAARKKAAEIRQRAREDVEHWEREATERVKALRADLDAGGEQILADANAAAKSTLSQAEAGAAAVAAAAESEALAMRAEAEREAIRIVADARRHADEVRRSGSVEADQMVAQARIEADRIIEGALVGERPESSPVDLPRTEPEPDTDPTLPDVAEEHDDETSREDENAPPASDDGDQNDADDDDATYPSSSWPEDDGTVRIVPADRLMQDTGDIDADEMVAEIEMLRLSTLADDEPGDQPEVLDLAEPEVADDGVAGDSTESDPDAGSERVVPDEETAEGETADADPDESASSWTEADTQPEDVDELSPGVDGAGTILPDAAEEYEESVAGNDLVPVEPVQEASNGFVSDAIAAFDNGWSSSVDKDVDESSDDAEFVPEPADTDVDSGDAPVDEGVDEIPDGAWPAAPEAEVEHAVDDEPAAPVAGLDNLFALLRSGPGPDLESPVPVGDAESEVSDDVVAETAAADRPEPVTERPDPSVVFEVRDRRLLPIENAALRDVKRHLLDLQNRTLDDLRVAKGDWSLDAADLSASLTSAVDALVVGAADAGWDAVAELAGRTADGSVPAVIAVDDLATALAAAVTDAYAVSRSNEAGDREVSAAVSKVFRAWRTDEAERRVRRTAHAAYHDGLLAGLVSAGVPRVTVVTDGRPCPGCGASTSDASWNPSEPVPSWVQLPSTHIDCVATISPA